VPWYQPALATLGALLLLGAVARRRSITRLIALVLVAAFAGLDSYFVVSMSKLPRYEGPVRVGQKMPAFRTAKADGTPFTEKDLQAGKSSVLVFNRGRW
jgi:cytochrome oxidase Cu insertion factor (SCO1/SenC/PrrC family)